MHFHNNATARSATSPATPDHHPLLYLCSSERTDSIFEPKFCFASLDTSVLDNPSKLLMTSHILIHTAHFLHRL